MTHSPTPILVVSNDYPFPPTDGHKVRVLNLLRNLPDRYCFDFVAFGDENCHAKEGNLVRSLGDACRSVELVSRDTLSRLPSLHAFGSFQNVLHPDVKSIGPPFYSDAMERRIGELSRSGKYSLVYVCGLYAFVYLHELTESPTCLVDIVDCPSLLSLSYFREERRLMAALKKFFSYFWARRYEKVRVSQIQNILMITDVDAKWIAGNCKESRIWVISNGVDSSEFIRKADSVASPDTLLFTGVMNYAPNDAAMLFFIREVLPLIRREWPSVRLVVAGRDPSPELKELAQATPDVVVTGYVEDIRPYFSAACIYVSPLLSGAGLKNKVLEAWAMSLPVVATSVTCSGMSAESGRNLLIADTPADFASNVLRLLGDEALRKRLAAAGRTTVEQEYSWASRGTQLGAILDRLSAEEAVSPGVHLLPHRI